jgi:hypothetical protein
LRGRLFAYIGAVFLRILEQCLGSVFHYPGHAALLLLDPDFMVRRRRTAGGVGETQIDSGRPRSGRPRDDLSRTDTASFDEVFQSRFGRQAEAALKRAVEALCA